MTQDQATYGFSKPDAQALAESIGTEQTEYIEGRVRSSKGGASAKFAYASSGIPAATGSTTKTPGSASVTNAAFNGTTITQGSGTFTAYNMTDFAIGSGVFVLCTEVDGAWFVHLASGCGS